MCIGNKVVGEFIADTKSFQKVVKYSVHHLHSYRGWAIDKSIIEELAKLGCEKIEIKDKETDKIYWTLFSKFQDRSFEMKHNGYGIQLVLSDGYWTLEDSRYKQGELELK